MSESSSALTQDALRALNQELRRAAQLDRPGPLSDLLAKGANANDQAGTVDGRTALMEAASRGNIRSLEVLLPHSDAKLANDNGFTALIFAAASCHADCVELLLPASDSLARNDHGQDALSLATLASCVKCVKVLLAADVSFQRDLRGQTPLHHAARAGAMNAQKQQELFALLLAASGPECPNVFDSCGRTPLMSAVCARNPEGLRILADHCDLSLQDPKGRTALEQASRSGFWEGVELLATHPKAHATDIEHAFAICPEQDQLPLTAQRLVAIAQAAGSDAPTALAGLWARLSVGKKNGALPVSVRVSRIAPAWETPTIYSADKDARFGAVSPNSISPASPFFNR